MVVLNAVILILATCTACILALLGVSAHNDAKTTNGISKYVMEIISISMFTLSFGIGYFVVTTVADYF